MEPLGSPAAGPFGRVAEAAQPDPDPQAERRFGPLRGDTQRSEDLAQQLPEQMFVEADYEEAEYGEPAYVEHEYVEHEYHDDRFSDPDPQSIPADGGTVGERRGARRADHAGRSRRPLAVRVARLVTSRAPAAPYVAPGRSALVHWRLVAVIVFIALVNGLAFGTLTAPTYTAEAQLYVGKTLSLTNTAAIPGLQLAANQVASDYSRLISSGPVVTDAIRRLGSHGGLPGSLTASPIPDTPQVLVTGTAGDQATAIAIANAGAAALVDTVNQINAAAQDDLSNLLTQYGQIEQGIGPIQAQINTLQAQVNALQGQSGEASQVAGLQGQISALQRQIASQNLQAEALQNQYQTQFTPLAAEEQVVKQLGKAVALGSNRKRTLEVAALVGILGGLLIGVAVASLVDINESRRRRPAS